jgi:transposase
MSIPVKLSESAFQIYIEPHLSKALRGYVSKIPLYKIFNYILYVLYTGCQWQSLPIENKQNNPSKKEISYQAVYYHFRKWSRDGSLKKVFKSSIKTIGELLNLSEINFDGSHTISKKWGESVKYQGRKKAKTSNILPVTEEVGNIIATTQIIAGNHHGSFELKERLKEIFKYLKSQSLDIKGAYFNADSAFDTKEARKVCWNYGVIPNIDENQRNLRRVKRGRKRHFNKEVYNNRFCIERSFAWVDKFKRLLIRFERKDIYFLGFHFIAFTMINFRNLIC